MLAVKATYENGQIKWSKQPDIHGQHRLIVVFEDVEQPQSPPDSRAVKKECLSWEGFDALIGCAAVREDGAERHDAYLAEKRDHA
jgi:hypothetical protein